MKHADFVKNIIESTKLFERVKSRERNDLEYKESFVVKSIYKYAKTMAAFANNRGGYILFGIKDNPREVVGVNKNFEDFQQEKFTEILNALFSPEIEWESGIVEFDQFKIGYVYTNEAENKPVIALKNESSEKINSGDVFYRYRARSEKIKYPEMKKMIDDLLYRERKRLLILMEAIQKNDTTNLGIVNYNNGRFSTPYGSDVTVDKKLIIKVLRKAKYIKSGQFDEINGMPAIRVTGNIDLAEEIPVPDIEPDIQYPYLQKNLAEKLNIKSYEVQSLIWYYKMKGIKKYHMEVSSTASGNSKVNKYSDIALQFLAERINENKENDNWLDSIKREYKERISE